MSKYSSSTPRVVSLNGPGRIRSPGHRILAECREQLVDGLCAWLRDVAAPVSEELFVLADSTRDRLKQTRYLDLRADVEKDWQHLVETFRRELTAEARRSLEEEQQKAARIEAPIEIPDFEGLSLVDDADLSEHIVLREFSAQLSETCDNELYTLNRRVAALLGLEETAGEMGNPLAPAVICRALSDSCATIGADSESRLLLLRRLERHLHVSLPDIYRQINAYLIEHGILPDLKRTYRRSTAASGTTATSPPSEAVPAQAPTAGSPAQGTVPASGEAILDALQRLALARTGSGAMRAGPLPEVGGTASPGGITLDPATVNRLLLSSLNELQHAPVGEPGGAIVNQVRLVRDSADAQQASGLEAVTMDIVAMLFDFIFDDPRIPVAIKALISRLQIPVLKVAMLNPGFFADRQHPTRRFLASISGISIRWGSAVDESDPFYAKLAELVGHIQTEFNEDVEVFGTALAELNAFVSEREAEDDSTALAAADLVIKHEQEAEAWDRARHTVRSFLKDNPQPAPIADFLAEQWASVLQAIAVESGSRGEDWKAATGFMKDLAWSIVPKKSPDDRLKLVGLLPGLLSQLNRGLDRIEMEQTPRTAFFDTLVKCHSTALKGETPSEPEKPPEEPSPSFAKGNGNGDLLVTRSIDNGVQVEEVVLVGASPVWRPGDQDIFRQVNELKRGDWVEFLDENGNVNRERLNWISPQRGILLFSNHRSAKAISIAPDALARQIRDGKAAIVHEEPIFERALNVALESVSAA